MTVICPKCGRSNPDEAYICQFCDAPLVTYIPPEIPIEGEKPAEDQQSDEWLENLRKKKEEDAKVLGEDFFNRFGQPANEDESDELDSSARDPDQWLTMLSTEGTPPPQDPLQRDGDAPTPEWLEMIRARINSESGEPQPDNQDQGEDWLNKLRKQTEELKPPPEGLPGWAKTEAPLSDIIEEVAPPEEPVSPLEESNEEPDLPQIEAEISVLPNEPAIPASPPPFFESEAELAAFQPLDQKLPEGVDFNPQAPAEPEHPIPEALRNSIPAIDASQFSEELIPSEEELLQMQDEPRDKIPSREIPNWLSSILGENEAEATSMSAVDATQKDQAVDGMVQPGAIPGWVQAMRPTEIITPQKSGGLEIDRHVDENGPLAGIKGTLSGESTIPVYTRVKDYHVGLDAKKKREENISLFKEVVSSEQKESKVPGYRRARAAGTVRWVLAALMTLILVFAMMRGLKPENLPGSMPKETIQLFQAIGSLQPGDKVLIALDYEPAYAGELEAAVNPVLNHLMVRQADLYIISTSPAGSSLAMKMLAGMSRFPQPAQAPYQSGESFHILGYLPGGQAGIQLLNQGPVKAIPVTPDLVKTSEFPALTEFTSLADFKALLVLSDQPDTVRAWLEQMQINNGQPALWAVVSAQAVPMLRPYVRSGQLQGLAAGEYGGALYERILQQPGVAWGQWNVYQTGLLTAILLVLLGGALNYTGQWILQSRRKKSA